MRLKLLIGATLVFGPVTHAIGGSTRDLQEARACLIRIAQSTSLSPYKGMELRPSVRHVRDTYAKVNGLFGFFRKESAIRPGNGNAIFNRLDFRTSEMPKVQASDAIAGMHYNPDQRVFEVYVITAPNSARTEAIVFDLEEVRPQTKMQDIAFSLSLARFSIGKDLIALSEKASTAKLLDAGSDYRTIDDSSDQIVYELRREAASRINRIQGELKRAASLSSKAANSKQAVDLKQAALDAREISKACQMPIAKGQSEILLETSAEVLKSLR